MKRGRGSEPPWWVQAFFAGLVAAALGLGVWAFFERPWEEEKSREQSETQAEEAAFETTRQWSLGRLRFVQDQLATETQSGQEEGPCPPETAPDVIQQAVEYVAELDTAAGTARTADEFWAIGTLLQPSVLNVRFDPCVFLVAPGSDPPPLDLTLVDNRDSD